VAVKVLEGVAQVKVKEAGETTAVGKVASTSTTASALAVQPFAEVTVTEYMPAAETDKVDAVSPLLHK
jgi:hypothetical protein